MVKHGTSSKQSLQTQILQKICKIIEIEGDILKCVYPPDSYVFSYRRDSFEQFFRLLRM